MLRSHVRGASARRPRSDARRGHWLSAVKRRGRGASRGPGVIAWDEAAPETRGPAGGWHRQDPAPPREGGRKEGGRVRRRRRAVGAALDAAAGHDPEDLDGDDRDAGGHDIPGVQQGEASRGLARRPSRRSVLPLPVTCARGVRPLSEGAARPAGTNRDRRGWWCRRRRGPARAAAGGAPASRRRARRSRRR